MTAIGATAETGSPIDLESDRSCCNLVELRQYTLHPGQRDTLIELFDREFVEPQEALGIAVIGQFRDMDRPDRYVWLRGFESLEARGQALAAFYDGRVWKAHASAANATMIDSDNVLLLQPAGSGRGFHRLPARKRSTSTSITNSGLIVAMIYYTKPESLESFSTLFDQSIRKRLESAGALTVAEYITSTQVNNFPRLPIRLGEHVFVWLAHFGGVEAYNSYLARMAADPEWQRQAWPAIREQLAQEPEVLRLVPTTGSRLRG